ncbi:Protein-lysine N-methyltransferase EEF2KMT [Sciurus carolinensis]|uniref:Protein-lysine N-methyltransferase EEF2KMT n=1 Tax=Sciurus carolinensis TaxID=30640 RepID=A0AA41MXE3_SCICA|nr:Protein-lysine N-methyltransferase EEF2KMT [Sciurus carolinensis]
MTESQKKESPWASWGHVTSSGPVSDGQEAGIKPSPPTLAPGGPVSSQTSGPTDTPEGVGGDHRAQQQPRSLFCLGSPPVPRRLSHFDSENQPGQAFSVSTLSQWTVPASPLSGLAQSPEAEQALVSSGLANPPWASYPGVRRGRSYGCGTRPAIEKSASVSQPGEGPPNALALPLRRWSFTKAMSTTEVHQRHEAIHTEPLDELYEALAEVLTTEEPTQCHRSYVLPSGDWITLSESTAIVSHGTTGLVTWDAALYLAEWAIANPAAFRHRTVLELGSGAGLTGLTICKACCPRAYIFSDCHSRVLEQLRGNVLLNGLSLEPEATAGPECPLVTVAQLDWDAASTSQLSAFQPDTVIAADVLYCPEVTLALVGVLQRLSACRRDQAPDVYVAFTMRNPETYQLFTTELGESPRL